MPYVSRVPLRPVAHIASPHPPLNLQKKSGLRGGNEAVESFRISDNMLSDEEEEGEAAPAGGSGSAGAGAGGAGGLGAGADATAALETAAASGGKGGGSCGAPVAVEAQA